MIDYKGRHVGFFNIEYGKKIEKMDVDRVVEMVMHGFERHAEDFNDTDTIYVYKYLDGTGLLVQNIKSEDHPLNFLKEEKISAFFSNSKEGRRAFYKTFLPKDEQEK